jgi:hypothetical protein
MKGGCPFDSKTDENPVYTQFDGTLRIYSEMRPIPDILAGDELGSHLSTQIQEIEDIKNNVSLFRTLDVNPLLLIPNRGVVKPI